MQGSNSATLSTLTQTLNEDCAMPIRIRDVKSMKSAPISEADQFRTQHPGGKFIYYDSDTMEAAKPEEPVVTVQSETVNLIEEDFLSDEEE